MKILVCLSNVPDTTSKINFTADASAFDPKGVVFVMNPYDEFGLTRAIWLKEKQGAHITVVNVGDASSDQMLRKALAMGVDDAIRVDSAPHDAKFVSDQLYKVAKDGDYDLIITGRESIDYNGAIVPGLLASKLNIPFVNGAINLEITDNTAEVTREIEGGEEVIKANLPMLIAGQKGLVEEKDLKIPNMRGIMMAKRKPLNVLTPEDSLAKTCFNNFEKPKPKGEVKLVDADNAEELLEKLSTDSGVL